MRSTGFLLLLVISVLLLENGCSLTSHRQRSAEATNAAKRKFLDSPPDWNKDIEDPYGYVGDVASENRLIEKETDPWYRNLLMSPEARNIERNLGIVD